MHSEEILEDLIPQIRASLAEARHCEAHPIGAEAISKSGIASSGPSVGRPRNDNDPILQLLAKGALSFDELAIALNQEPAQVQSQLIKLELEGAIRRVFGGQYVRS